MYYKWLADLNGKPPYQSGFRWPMPASGRPGKWVHATGKLVLCENGIHACREDQLVHHIAPVLCEIELGGKIVADKDKVVARKGRLVRVIETWNDRKARLFACDCAERALDLYGVKVDPRSRRAIEVARRYAVGDASDGELTTAWDAAGAAWDAAGAAWDAGAAAGAAREGAGAAWDAAWAAAGAASAAARDAAACAARAAARAAATSAAWAAAWAAERAWQTKHLLSYLEDLPQS